MNEITNDEALTIGAELVADWSEAWDPHGYHHVRPVIARLLELATTPTFRPCSTCRHLMPAVPGEPDRWEDRDGAKRHVAGHNGWDAVCGHPDDEVASVLYRDDDAELCIHKPAEFGCTRWEPQP